MQLRKYQDAQINPAMFDLIPQNPKIRDFWGPKSKICHDSKYNLQNQYLHLKVSTNSWKNVGGVGFLVIDTWAKWDFEIWPFCGLLEAKVINLRLIDFQLGFSLNINENDGQN